MMTIRCCLLSFLAIGLFVSQSEAQIIPNVMCQACAVLFRSSGCFNRPSLMCRLLASKLNARTGSRVSLCPQYTCEGYGTSGTSCIPVGDCSSANADGNGICPLGQVCCKASIPS